MASVFLSYDRDDSAKARSIALALEKAGHSVWWDQHIKGGSRYATEIEKALSEADAVVVLWSRNSVQSDWVRDEAAKGRDSGRLVPTRIDNAELPLGFGQHHTTDLSKWRGRTGSAPFKALLDAIDGVGNGAMVAPPAVPSRSPLSRNGPIVQLAATILVAMIAVLAVILWQPWRTGNRPPLVAIAAAEPGSATESLAADLLIKLGVLQSSHADALQLIDVNSRQTPDFIIKVGSANASSSSAEASLMLVDHRAGAILWSGEFSAPSGKPADLRQQMAYSAAKVLDCAVQALSAKREKIELPTLKLYLSGCANMSNLLAQDPGTAVRIFKKVTDRAPKFEGAWKKLILADIQAFRINGRSDLGLRRKLQDRVVQARRLHPAIAEAYLAESWLRPPRPVTGWVNLVQQALAKDPNNPDILAYDSLAKANVGLMEDSLADTRHAVKSDPLSPSARDALITALLNNGQVDAARDELKKLEQLWPGATNVLQSRFAIEFRFGDAAQALAILRSGQLGAAYSPTSAQGRIAHESYLRARIEPTASNKERAISDARTFYAQDPTASWVVSRALSEFGTLDDLIAFFQSSDAHVPPNTTWTLFRTTFSHLHRDPRFMQVAARLGLVDYWMEVGKWPDFCADTGLPYDCKAEAAKLN